MTRGGARERRLARAAAEGDRAAIEALVARHWDSAYRAAYLVLLDAGAAEDVAQESMLQAIDKLDQFEDGRPFGPWLRRIVVNRALDAVRARARRRELPIGDGALDVRERATGSSDAGLSARLVDALDQLDAADRAALVLRHVFGYRSGEIGRMLGMPAATVRTRLRRGLHAVRVHLAGEHGGSR